MITLPKVTSHAIVTVTLEIDLAASQGWGTDCSLGQVYKQAREEAIDKLARALRPNTGLFFDRSRASGNVKIIGTPDVRSVIIADKAR